MKITKTELKNFENNLFNLCVELSESRNELAKVLLTQNIERLIRVISSVELIKTKEIIIKESDREYNISCINDLYGLADEQEDFDNEDIAEELKMQIETEYYSARNEKHEVNIEELEVIIIKEDPVYSLSFIDCLCFNSEYITTEEEEFERSINK